MDRNEMGKRRKSRGMASLALLAVLLLFLCGCGKKGHLEQLAELDNRFHDIMYEACNSKILERQLKDFHQYVLRVRKKTLANVNRGPKSNEEHKNIMEAIKAGDGDLAERLAHQHMINAYENMVKNGLREAYVRDDMG